MTTLSFGDSYGRVPQQSRVNRTPLSFGGSSTPAKFDPLWSFGGSLGLPLSMGQPFGFGHQFAATSAGGTSGKNTAAAPQTTNIANLDGSAAFQTNLSGFGASLLEGIGGQRDAPAPYAQPASFGIGSQNAGNTDLMMFLALGAAGVAAYWLLASS